MAHVKFHKKLYIGKSVLKKARLIKWKLYMRRHFVGLYVLMLPFGNDGQLEIINANYLTQKLYKKFPPTIVGFAGSYDEATDIVVELAEKVHSKTGDIKIRDYILSEENAP